MNFYISYFYQIRFMKPNQIPISTAAWDPKWFHEGLSKDHKFLNPNGVLNGVRFKWLSPENLSKTDVCCPCELHKKLIGSCKFLNSYNNYLHSLDFDEVIDGLTYTAKLAAEKFDLEEPEDIILIVYETPNNPCSERGPLIEWFKENGVELKEWKK